MHNCIVLLTEMGGMVTADEGSRGDGPDVEVRSGAGARPGGQPGAGHEPQNFTYGQREPFVFGLIHPSEVPGLRGESGGAQVDPQGPLPGMPPGLFNMSQFFRMSGPPTAADDSANASNRRSTGTALSVVRLGAVPPTAHALRLVLPAPLLCSCCSARACPCECSLCAFSVRHVCAYMFPLCLLSFSFSLSLTQALCPFLSGGAKFTPAAASDVCAAQTRPGLAWT